MTQLSAGLIRDRLPTLIFGQNVIYAKQVNSTNTALKELARQGAPAGTLYLADEQLAGRGRLNRQWIAPAESSLLLSLLFRPGNSVNPAQSQRLTMLCALALADAVSTITGLNPNLKWPNDLVWQDGKKLAGILTELEIDDDRLSWAVVGVGLNVNVDFKQVEFDPTLWQTATSLSMILGRNTAAMRLPLTRAFLVNVEQRYHVLQQDQLPYPEWRSRLVGLGQPAIISDINGQQHQGLLADVDQDGALRLQRPDGSMSIFTAGDVSLRIKE